MKDVPVLIVERSRRSKVARRIRSLGLERNGIRLVHAHIDVTLKLRAVGYLPEPYVGISHRPHPAKVVVGLLQVGGTERFPCLYGSTVFQHP